MKISPGVLNSITSKNLSEVATLRNLNFKILRMRYIKLAQKTLGAKISASQLS
jgi:hypothetical protein